MQLLASIKFDVESNSIHKIFIIKNEQLGEVAYNN